MHRGRAVFSYTLCSYSKQRLLTRREKFRLAFLCMRRLQRHIRVSNKMRGKHCCVVGCTNHSVKTGGNVSYFSFPMAAADSDWRRALIMKVNRCDPGFNPKSQHICSAHFDPKCLLFHGKSAIKRPNCFFHILVKFNFFTPGVEQSNAYKCIQLCVYVWYVHSLLATSCKYKWQIDHALVNIYTCKYI